MVDQVVLGSHEPVIRRFAIELAALIGLSCEGILDEIIVDRPGDYPVLELGYGGFKLDQVGKNWKLTLDEENYNRGLELVACEIFDYDLGDLPEFSGKKAPDHGLFTEFNSEDDLFVREGKVKVYEGDLSHEFINLAALAVARITMDTNAMELPLVTDCKDQANLRFISADHNRMVYGEGLVFEIEDSTVFKKVLISRKLEKTKFLVDQVTDAKSFEWQFIKAYSQSDEIFIEPTTKELKKVYESNFENLKLASYKEKRVDASYEFSYPWEREVFLDKLEELKTGKSKIVAIEGAISEPREVRHDLREEISDLLKIERDNVQIINSYKQGFSWIEEDILPKLKNTDLDWIDIAWTAFQKEDEAWTAEEGAIPTYNNTDIDNHGRWYDLPIRLLQELYPIDDLLSRNLGIDRNQIQFPMEKGDFSYRVRAYCGEECIFEDQLEAVFSEWNYLDAYPGMGLVHPSTGYIKAIYQDGSEKMKVFPTDLENIWADYQEVLVKLGDEITDKKLAPEDQPFFADLHMEMTLSEEDRRLGIREDTISSIDGFHEDLYFTGLDYFKVLGEQVAGQAFDAPGLILPEIHNKTQPPEFTCELRRFLDHRPFVMKGNERIYLDMDESKAELAGFEICDDKVYLMLNTNLSDQEEKIFKRILTSGASLLSELDLDGVILGHDRVTLGRPPRIKGALPDMETKVYNYQDSEVNLEFLKDRVDVTYLGQSFLGRKIRAMDLIKPSDRFESTYRSSELRPSLYINARHHANEVSSTNAAYLLAETALKKPELLDKVNLVILPMENPDGSEIHAQLMEEHPDWIFHIARFNALGKEFSLEYFKNETIHTEALPLGHIFHRHLPDVYIDNHGVPTHEWNQQFSGYTAPAYKGFWLPRSLLYGYFWYPEGDEWKANYNFAKAMEDRIADGINGRQEMRDLNLEWKDRFEKYAHQWMPKMFPTGYYKDMIFYWIGFKPEPTHRYLSIRHPEITLVGYTSEVIDETAQGDHMTLCVHAQLENNLSAMELISKRDIKFDKIISLKNNVMKVYRKRRRI